MLDLFSITIIPYKEDCEFIRVKYPEDHLPKVGEELMLDGTLRIIKGTAFERSPEMIQDHIFDLLFNR
jgi:hypothetical protein